MRLVQSILPPNSSERKIYKYSLSRRIVWCAATHSHRPTCWSPFVLCGCFFSAWSLCTYSIRFGAADCRATCIDIIYPNLFLFHSANPLLIGSIWIDTNFGTCNERTYLFSYGTCWLGSIYDHYDFLMCRPPCDHAMYAMPKAKIIFYNELWEQLKRKTLYFNLQAHWCIKFTF